MLLDKPYDTKMFWAALTDCCFLLRNISIYNALLWPECCSPHHQVGVSNLQRWLKWLLWIKEGRERAASTFFMTPFDCIGSFRVLFMLICLLWPLGRRKMSEENTVFYEVHCCLSDVLCGDNELLNQSYVIFFSLVIYQSQ